MGQLKYNADYYSGYEHRHAIKRKHNPKPMNLTSLSGTEDMKLFTVYSLPEHSDGVVHATKADALAHPQE